MAFMPDDRRRGRRRLRARRHAPPGRPRLRCTTRSTSRTRRCAGDQDGGSLVVYGRKDAEINLKKQLVITAKEHDGDHGRRAASDGPGDVQASRPRARSRSRPAATITIESTGEMTIKSTAGINVEATGPLKLKGADGGHRGERHRERQGLPDQHRIGSESTWQRSSARASPSPSRSTGAAASRSRPTRPTSTRRST